MINWTLNLVLMLFSIPGILVTAPVLGRGISRTMTPRLPKGTALPPPAVLGAAIGVEALFLVAVFAILGGLTAPQVGLSAPFFQALIFGNDAWAIFVKQLIPMLVGGILGGLVLVAGYYLIFRPRLDVETLSNLEGFRIQLGLVGRLLYGGIYEEVFTRWGLMSILAWLGLKMFGSASSEVMWGAIIVSGVVFGLLHIPNYVLTGSRLTVAFASLMIFLNLWASLVFGWLFWQYGLLASIGAHMLFHLVWYPFDLYFSRKVSGI